MKNKVSQYGPGSKVSIVKGQDPNEGKVGHVMQSLMTNSGDFVHLVRVAGYPDSVAPKIMYEEHDLRECK